ncbi:hypothetical protein EDD75_0368 [Thermodesulfitimonas autotrophica]|uniref:Uncharacterized protein n=1 Tax=Thermodesulfitimonas autotrophica TaxID=1894989 RepID=A0A3N5C078_9THEO|nr:hypothetical protein [Thermodesulfitimonas autotrophica]RPF49551.1 hypothetical protein EDD75_0368 [Thermodesulfitimonas autotrophica]
MEFLLTCSCCSQTFGMDARHLREKEHLECPNCANPVSKELCQALISLAKCWSEIVSERKWQIQIKGTAI